MTNERHCRMCGQPIHTERRKHGRDTSPSLWFVHTATDLVPCERTDVLAHRHASHASHTQTGGVTNTSEHTLIQPPSNKCDLRDAPPVSPLFATNHASHSADLTVTPTVTPVTPPTHDTDFSTFLESYFPS